MAAGYWAPTIGRLPPLPSLSLLLVPYRQQQTRNAHPALGTAQEILQLGLSSAAAWMQSAAWADGERDIQGAAGDVTQAQVDLYPETPSMCSPRRLSANTSRHARIQVQGVLGGSEGAPEADMQGSWWLWRAHPPTRDAFKTQLSEGWPERARSQRSEKPQR